MKIKAYTLLVFLLAACQPGVPPTSADALPASTLPPTWTATPPDSRPTTTLEAAIPIPTDSEEEAVLPTPLPPAYDESTWALRIEGPARWYSAESLVELSDGAILASGPVHAGGDVLSIWVARLTPAGQVSWLRTIPLGGSHDFFLSSLGAGSDGRGLLCGTVRYPSSSSSSGRDSYLLSIAPDGKLDGQENRYAIGTQLGEDGSMVLFNGLGAEKWSQNQELEWDIGLDFGAGYLEPPDYYPVPQLVGAYSLQDGSLFFAGTIEDLVVPGDRITRAGPDAGYTAYWFVRFSAAGDLAWKHFYLLDAIQEGEIHGAVTQDGILGMIGGKRQEVRTEDSFGYLPVYTWVRMMNPNGATIFHKRYLDLQKPGGIETTPEGGWLIYGVSYTEEGGNFFANPQARIVKLDASGGVEWARQFPEEVEVNAVLPLSDGTYLISLGKDMTFVRLDAQGWLSDCQDIPITETRMRVDNEPAQFDDAGRVPISLQFEDTAREQSNVPALGWSGAGFQVEEICRAFN